MPASDRKGSASASGKPAPKSPPGKSASGKPGGFERPPKQAVVAAVCAWLVPGLGHLLLGRRGRAALFAVFVLFAVVLGAQLHGHLFVPAAHQPFSWLGTVASAAMGLPYFVLVWGLGYQGTVTDIGFDYGKAFLLTAGLMNALVIFDAWDIAVGRKD